MQSIELTSEHREKLLEMANKLFPEYDKISIVEQEMDVQESVVFLAMFKTNEHFDMGNAFSFPCMGEHFHWFEFCMTHLTAKLNWLQFKGEIPTPVDKYPGRRLDIWFKVWSKLNCGPDVGMKQHPVDYLYEQFQKLKK